MAPRSKTAPLHSPILAEVIDLTSDTEEDINSDNQPPIEHKNVIAGNPITEYHLRILSGHEWLNDEIINAYLYTLQSSYTGAIALSTYFHPKLCKEGFGPSLKRWLRPVQPISSKKLVLIPINWENTHWALVAYHVESRVLSYYDSMMHRKSGMAILEKYLPVFLYLHRADQVGGEGGKETEGDEEDKTIEGVDNPLDDSLAELLGKLDLKGSKRSSSITLRIPEGQARQQDGSSCGVFLCKWAHFLASSGTDWDTKKPPFTQKDVCRHREDMIDTLSTFGK